MTTSLADILSNTIKAEQNHDVALAQERARAQGDGPGRAFAVVASFYDAARLALTEQIINRHKTSSVGVLVGDTGSRGENKEVAALLGCYQNCSLATSKASPYYSLWLEFEAWARSQGLKPFWSPRHDGVGIHSWTVLTVEPISSLARAR